MTNGRAALLRRRSLGCAATRPCRNSMPVTMAATTSTAAAVTGRRAVAAGAGGGEHGKFLGQFLRTAMRTFGILPVGRADEDFGVAPAFLTMKFVNRHERKLFRRGKNLKCGKRRRAPLAAAVQDACAIAVFLYGFTGFFRVGFL